MNRCAGFTILETMAVVLIIGLLAGAVMIKPTGWFQSARLDDAVDRVVFMDRLARELAEQPGQSVELVFDLETGGIVRRLAGAPPDQSEGRHRIALPNGYSIQRMRIRNTAITHRHAVVRYNPQGSAPTYALRIVGPDDQAAWLLVAGLTGDAMLLENTNEVEHVLEKLTS